MGCARSQKRWIRRRSGTRGGHVYRLTAKLGSVKAMQIEEFGGPENLKHVDLPDPEPGEGEVVIDVARAGINFADTHSIQNDYLAEQTLPLIPGGEVSGTANGRRVAAMIGNGG